MEAYPNAVSRLQELTLLRLRIAAQSERAQKLKSRAACVTGACTARLSMEDRIIAAVDAERRLERLKRTWKEEAAKAAALLSQLGDVQAARALRLVYVNGMRAPRARKALGIGEEAFTAAFKRGLCAVENILNTEEKGNDNG